VAHDEHLTTPATDASRIEEAFAWVERTLGGKLIEKEQQARWRPQWFLKAEMPDGTVRDLMLRGRRAPFAERGEEIRREELYREALVTRALQGTDVKVAEYYGFEPNDSWMLVGRLPGSPNLGDVEDLDRQKSIFRQYMENIAALHRLDPGTLALDEVISTPKSHEETIKTALNEYLGPYEEYRDKDPEPLIELALWFAATHEPKRLERMSLCTGDPGINNFMFDDNGVTGIYDFEIAYIGDPLREICQMRLKTMCHGEKTGYLRDLPEHIRYWAECVGVTLDRESIGYWTVIAMLQGPLITYRGMRNPDPSHIAEMAHYNCFMPIYRRGMAEALAEYYDVDLEEPVRPVAKPAKLGPIYNLVRRQLTEFHAPHAEGRNGFLLETTERFANILAIDSEIGEQVGRDNLYDLNTLLGTSFTDESDALTALQARIRENPIQDIAKVLQCLFNVEFRNEWFFEPVQRWAKYRSGGRMERLF